MKPGCPYAARPFLCLKKLKKSEKICFFLPNALDKRFSSAILVVLTGKTGNNARPESRKEKGTKIKKS